VLVRKTIFSKFKVKQILKHYKDMVFLKCECAENHNTIIMGFLYIPPENSTFYNSQTTNNGIDILEEALFEIESNFEDYKLLLAGDFNVRTAELEDFVVGDKGNYVPGLQYIINDDRDSKSDIAQCKRNNKDKISNSFGRSLVQLCGTNDMCIINGRKTGDNDGEFTYLCPSGASVIDYVISSYNLSNWISNFNVLSIDLSKHLPISCCLEIPVKQNVYSGSDNCVKQKRYKWVTKNVRVKSNHY